MQEDAFIGRSWLCNRGNKEPKVANPLGPSKIGQLILMNDEDRFRS